MKISEICANSEDEPLDKAESICEIIEEEINNGNQTFEKVKTAPTKEFVCRDINLETSSVDNETQNEVPPSEEGKPRPETKEERMARFQELVRKGRGQINKKTGEFTPISRPMNLNQDAKERG